MIFDDEADHDASYWPSVSDLFLTLFIISISLVGVVVFVFLPNPAEKLIVSRIIAQVNEIRNVLGNLPPIPETAKGDELAKAVEDTTSEALKRLMTLKQMIDKRGRDAQSMIQIMKRLEALETENKQLRVQLKVAEEEVGEISAKEAGGKRLEQKPPIITIADADKRHFFASGSAVLTQDFEADLEKGGFQEIALEISRRNSNGQLNVDTLEVIGHTDGVPVASRGNLDAMLPSVLGGGEGDLMRLTPGSNNDLGLLRALAIKQAWGKFVAQHPARPQLEAIDVRTYSAGQTIPVEAGRFRVEDARSRRIELRLTKLR